MFTFTLPPDSLGTLNVVLATWSAAFMAITTASEVWPRGASTTPSRYRFMTWVPPATTSGVFTQILSALTPVPRVIFCPVSYPV